MAEGAAELFLRAKGFEILGISLDDKKGGLVGVHKKT